MVGIGGGFVDRHCCSTRLFDAFGIDLPTTSLVIETPHRVVSLLVGVLVTFLSSLVPALRSTRVPPIAALHAFTPPPEPPPPARLRVALGSARRRRPGDGPRSASSAAAAPAAAAGADRRRRPGDRPRRSRSSARAWCRRWRAVAGWPLERLRRLTGRLARENAQRNPSRTAVTAAALMIGLALVAFVTVFAAGLKSTVAQVVDENFAGGLVIQNTDGFSPIPAGAAVAARKVPGVESVATIRSAQAKLVGGGGDDEVTAPSPRHRQDGRRRMEAGRARRRCASSATAKRSSPTPSPPTTTSRSATASAC